MLANIRIVILFFLIHISSTTSNIVIQEKPLDHNAGWRCGRKIITHEAFLAATNNAINRVPRKAGLSLDEIDHLFPERYRGYFGFKGENGYNILWPFIDGEPTLASDEKSSQGIFVVLRLGNPLEPIGVVEKFSFNRYLKCIKERDLSDMWGHAVINGYRCPQDIFSMEMVEKEVSLLIDRSHKKNYMYRTRGYPANFDGSKLFGTSERLLIWPVIADKGFNPQALTTIVIDNEMNLIGMVHRKDGTYLRCTVTPFLDRMHKFIQTNILQKIDLPSAGEDIFQCKNVPIQSGIVLKSAIEAVRGFKLKSRAKDRKFPRLVASSDDPNNPGNYYLWPVILEGSTVYKAPVYKSYGFQFKSNSGIFLVINDFSDVAGVVEQMSRAGDVFEKCEREIISSSGNKNFISPDPT